MLITVVSEAKVTLIYFAKESNLFLKKNNTVCNNYVGQSKIVEIYYFDYPFILV